MFLRRAIRRLGRRGTSERVSASGGVESWMGLGYLLRDSLNLGLYLFLDFLYSNLLGPAADDPTRARVRGREGGRRGEEREKEVEEGGGRERDVENRVA